DDRKKRDLADTRIRADALIFSTERIIKDMGEKLKKEETAELNDKIESLRKLLPNGAPDAIKQATEDLAQRAQKIGAALYQQQKTEAKPGSGEKTQNTQDNVVEGQYEDLKGDQKDKK
ncbi:MAG: Hsp70 family protein, partial [Parcubacteria group bacterium]|nr:Hsp70 family protein [Parcubacteria group bacterium]